MVQHIKGNELEKLIASSDKTVYCDFWANWCGPCKMLAPVFETLSEEYADKAVFVKVDVDEDENQAVAMKYRISSIPNIIAFKAGAPVGNSVGFVPEAMLKAFVEKYL